MRKLYEMANVKSYPSVKKRIASGKLQVHGWWFDIRRADVYHYDKKTQSYLLIDEMEAQRMLRENPSPDF